MDFVIIQDGTPLMSTLLLCFADVRGLVILFTVTLCLNCYEEIRCMRSFFTFDMKYKLFQEIGANNTKTDQRDS